MAHPPRTAGRSRRLARTAWTLFRASHPVPVVAVTAATALLAAASGRGPKRALVAIAAVLAGQLFTGWTNDLLDVDLDRRANRRDKPLAGGQLDAGTIRRAMAAALPATLVLSRLVGKRELRIHGAGIALAAAYNLGLRATPLSFLPYAAAFALLPPFALGAWPPAWVVATSGCLGVAGHLAQVLPDIEDDREQQVLGLPQRLGTRGSSVAIGALLTGCAASLAANLRTRPAAFWAGGAAAAAPAVTYCGLTARPKAAFRMTLAAAGCLGAGYAASLLGRRRDQP